MAQGYHKYYYNAEKHCAYFALRLLEYKLSEPKEFGTTIFRWRVGGETRYSFQEPVYSGSSGRWRPLGKIPSGTEEWSHCHTHPNGSYFSNWDTAWARGESGFDYYKRKFTIYLVNKSGGYWYDGVSEFMSHSERFGTLFKN